MQQNLTKLSIKKLIAVLLFVVILIVGYLIYKASVFHVVSTNPSVDNISTITPFFNVNFNRVLSNNSQLSVTSDPDIVSSYGISNKAIDISLKNGLTAGSVYYINITGVSDVKGEHLSNLRFKIVPKLISFNNLPKDQQSIILKNQSAGSASQGPNFSGNNSLINDGVSIDQIQLYQQAITNFGTASHVNVKNVVIDPNSVASEPLDTYSDGSFGINFNVSINGVSYLAKFHCITLTQADLVLFSNGNQIFDSGVLNFTS